jgi:hypothetical protein
MTQRDQEWLTNLKFIHQNNDTSCIELLRMRRAPFFQLRDLFRTRGLLKDLFSQIEK